MDDITGVIVINKPEGITSTKVVEKVRRLLKVKKAGHLGTLDPIAVGVLPIAVGKATKLSQLFMEKEKEYIARIKLGILTDTYDREGKVIKQMDIPELSVNYIEEVLSRFVGEIEQIPPMYSAKRYKGKRLYELARKGIEVEREPKKVTVHDIKLINYEAPFLKLYIKAGKGVYIRALAKDIGEALNTTGTLWDLVRTSAGGFNLEQAISLDELKDMELEERRKVVIPLNEALKDMPVIKVMGRLKWWIMVGNAIVTSASELKVESLYEGMKVKIIDEDEVLVALGVVKRAPDGRWICHPDKVLYTV